MASPTKHRVLVVDDNRDVAMSTSELLVLSGFEVETCFDGPSALNAVERFTPDACLLDITMPGMNGYELAQKLRDRFPDDPPLFATMTAYGDYAHLERAADAGFDLHFTKPTEPVEVIEQLKQGIQNGPSSTESDADKTDGGGGRRSVLHLLLTRLTGLESQPDAGARN